MKHQIIPMDLVVIDTTKRRLFSFLSISWGIMADVDIESEKYRRLGAVRFTIGGLARILSKLKFSGRERWSSLLTVTAAKLMKYFPIHSRVFEKCI
jgi:sphingosine kinase